MTNKNGWNITKQEIEDLTKILEPYDIDSVDNLISEITCQYPYSTTPEVLNILLEIQTFTVLPEPVRGMLDDTINTYDIAANNYED